MDYSEWLPHILWWAGAGELPHGPGTGNGRISLILATPGGRHVYWEASDVGTSADEPPLPPFTTHRRHVKKLSVTAFLPHKLLDETYYSCTGTFTWWDAARPGLATPHDSSQRLVAPARISPNLSLCSRKERARSEGESKNSLPAGLCIAASSGSWDALQKEEADRCQSLPRC